jgi:hypothetical protein
MHLGVEKASISPQSPKTEFVLQNQYGRVIYDRKFNMNQEKIFFESSKRRK